MLHASGAAAEFIGSGAIHSKQWHDIVDVVMVASFLHYYCCCCCYRLQSMEPMQPVTRLRAVRLQQPSSSSSSSSSSAAGGTSSPAVLLDVRLAEEEAAQQAGLLVEMALAAREDM
jgi:hypothetical protein